MQEKILKKYAYYKHDDKEIYQYLPTGNLQDVIYDNMQSVSEVVFIKDGNHFIKVVEDDKEVAIGTVLTTEEILQRLYNNDPILKKYKEDLTDFFKSYEKDKEFLLDGNNELTFFFKEFCFSPNYGEIQSYENPHDIIDGSLHWYLELHNKDCISYESTLYNDKKYRGQRCDYYTFVRVVEYEIDGIKKKAIIGRDKNKYAYHQVEQTEIDDIIDEGKALISHKKGFKDFAGVSPLYVFNTEDSACVFHDRKDNIEGKTVTTVTGSGDAILDLFLYGAEKIISFDTNSMTRFFAELKFIAAKYLSFAEFIDFIRNFKEDIFRKIEKYLSPECSKVWNELYEYSNLSYNTPIKDAENGGLFYPTLSIFYSNSTIHNSKGYFNEENYLRLQEILKNKSLDDITFITCDLFQLPYKIDLNNSSYVYLSNIMDFIVGINENQLDKNALEKFKDFILKELLPKLKSGANIDLSYIKKTWHMYVNDNIYEEIYTNKEGFSMENLSNGKDKILSFKSAKITKMSNTMKKLNLNSNVTIKLNEKGLRKTAEKLAELQKNPNLTAFSKSKIIELWKSRIDANNCITAPLNEIMGRYNCNCFDSMTAVLHENQETTELDLNNKVTIKLNEKGIKTTELYEILRKASQKSIELWSSKIDGDSYLTASLKDLIEYYNFSHFENMIAFMYEEEYEETATLPTIPRKK